MAEPIISQEENFDILEKLADGTYKRKYPETKASQVKLQDVEGNFISNNLEGVMQELFTNVSNGKQLVGGAIAGVDNSITIPTEPTFQQLASLISLIETGINTDDATAVASDVLEGKTAYARGQKIIGVLVRGKKWAEGNIRANALGKVAVSGLDFKPSSIIIWGDSQPITVYNEKYSATHYMYVKSGLVAEYRSISGQVDPEHVSHGGFEIRGYAGDNNWVAVE